MVYHFNNVVVRSGGTMIKMSLRVSYWMDRASETITITEEDLIEMAQYKQNRNGKYGFVKAVEVVGIDTSNQCGRWRSDA